MSQLVVTPDTFDENNHLWPREDIKPQPQIGGSDNNLYIFRTNNERENITFQINNDPSDEPYCYIPKKGKFSTDEKRSIFITLKEHHKQMMEKINDKVQELLPSLNIPADQITLKPWIMEGNDQYPECSIAAKLDMVKETGRTKFYKFDPVSKEMEQTGMPEEQKRFRAGVQISGMLYVKTSMNCAEVGFSWTAESIVTSETNVKASGPQFPGYEVSCSQQAGSNESEGQSMLEENETKRLRIA